MAVNTALALKLDANKVSNEVGTSLVNVPCENAVRMELELKMQADELGGIVTVKPISQYGYEVSGTSETFTDETTVAYTESIASKKSVLRTIKFEPNATGEYQFGIGVIDWRTWGIIRKTFIINVTDILVTSYDISESNIIINEGEMIFLYLDSQNTIKFYDYSGATPLYAKGDDNVFVPIYKSFVVGSGSVVSESGVQAKQILNLAAGKYHFDFSNITWPSGEGDFNYQVFDATHGSQLFGAGPADGDHNDTFVTLTEAASLWVLVNNGTSGQVSYDFVATSLVDAATILAGPSQGIYAMELPAGKYKFDFSKIQHSGGNWNYGLQILPAGSMLFQKATDEDYSFEYELSNPATINGILNVATEETASFNMEVSLIQPISASLEWDLAPYTSIFAEKEDVSELESTVFLVSEKANVAYNNIAIVYDSLGYAYQLSVVGGEVVATGATIYKKIAVIGNSLMNAFLDDTYGRYGMAATVHTNDLCGDIMKEMVRRDASAALTRCDGASFEQALFTDSPSFIAMTSGIPSDADLIIVRLGENVSNTANMQGAFTALLNYLTATFTSAKVVITSTVLNYSAAYNVPLQNAAESAGVDYIDVQANDYATEMIGISRMYYQNGELHPSFYAIQTHSNDLGFLNTANAILSAINYKTLDIAHSISVESELQYDAPVLGVKDGWITVKTYGLTAPTITVTDANNNAILVQSLDLSEYTYDKHFADGVTEDTATFANVFVMPDGDVTITIA